MDLSDFRPTTVYRCPGSNPGPSGYTFDYKPAPDQDAFDLLTKQGWSPSIREAMETYDLNNESSTPGAAISALTPEERATAAAANRDDAADRALKAKNALDAETLNSVDIDKAYADASAAADAAEKVLADATDKANAARAARAAALQAKQDQDKVLHTAQLRSSIAQQKLTDAINRVLTADAAVSNATSQALAAAAARDKALSDAAAKQAGDTGKKGRKVL